MPSPVLDVRGRVLKDAGSVLPGPVLRRIRELSYQFMDYPDDLGGLAQSYYGPLIEGDHPGRAARRS